LRSCQGKQFDYHLELYTKANTPQTDKKQVEKVKKNLDGAYSHLGGNAFGRDKKGRVTKDDAQTTNEMQATGHAGGEDYNAYVYYHFEIA
jgi:V-type H+-transporting ATPase subunit C